MNTTTRNALLSACTALALVALAGCGPVRLVASTNIPTPLVTKMPIAVALFIPQEFKEYVHKEERWSTDWRVELGKAQSEGITRLLSSMFERVVPVESVSAGGKVGSEIRAILEPSIEEYAFVTPRDAGSPFFAVSIKYRVNVYMPDGKLADSWGFTGYGTSPSDGLSRSDPLATATALAMRDAGAKLAVEFREQAVVRGLLPDSPTADTLKAGQQPGGPSSEAPQEKVAVPALPSEQAQPAATGSETPPPSAPPQQENQAKDEAAKDQAAKDQAAKDQAAKDQDTSPPPR